jgi:hypothetical protein
MLRGKGGGQALEGNGVERAVKGEGEEGNIISFDTLFISGDKSQQRQSHRQLPLTSPLTHATPPILAL